MFTMMKNCRFKIGKSPVVGIMKKKDEITVKWTLGININQNNFFLIVKV